VRCGPGGTSLRPARRRAFTLLELLLVLVVVVAVLALAWPALDRPFANQRLRRGADQVRAALARARNRAMVEGVPYAFRFLPGGGEFRVGVYEALADSSGAAAQASATLAGGATAGGEYGGVLPRDVYFALSNAADTKTSAGGGGGTASDVHAVQADGWSLPVVLFPDGTSSSATITLASDAGRMIDVYLRGLSGSARAGEPYVVAGGP